MQIKYRILGVSEDGHSAEIRYYSDVSTEEDLAVRDVDTGEIIRHSDGSIKTCISDMNLTFFDVPALTGDALDEYISVRAPAPWFDLLEKIKDPAIDTSMTSLKDMIGVDRDVTIPPPPDPPTLPD
tara:strand:- start:3418 stop:3795 length:378 start_codon:yes stop_codon:yes gene_type:complete